MQPPADNIPHADASRQNPLDEPPWSPELLDLIAQAGHVWFCHDDEDADLLLRPDAGDFPALGLPLSQVPHWLTREVCQPLTTISVIQRPDDTLGDGFYVGYGVRTKQRLEAIGWRGTLYRVPLTDVAPTLPRLWDLVQEDRQRFQFELITLQQAGICEEIRGQRQRQRQKAQGPRPIIVSADQVEAKPILYLWEPYIPRGMPVLLDGDPGLGKGLMLVQVAANLSRGRPFLDQLGRPTLYADVEGPQTTLILSAEESLSHVMIPRLERAEADLQRIKFLTGWLGSEDQEHAFDLSRIDVLTQAIEDIRPVLVILDPLVAYLGDIDMHRSNETRPLMAALKTVAERYACTILGVRHPGKTDQGGRLMYRGQGNMDLIGAARSGLWVQPHPAHPDTQTLLLQSKSNVGKVGRTVIFTREDGNFEWKGVSRLTESMLTGKGPDPWSMLEAFFWLEEHMRPGHPYRSDQLEKDTKEEEISERTLRRAKKLLNIRSVKQGEEWYCILPPL